jgi:hypothetical protein
MGIPILLGMLSGLTMYAAGTDYIFKQAGYCSRPKLFAIILEFSTPQPVGLEKVLLAGRDFGCQWQSFNEIMHHDDDPEAALSVASNIMSGDFGKYYVWIRQSALLYDDVPPEIASPVIERHPNDELISITLDTSSDAQNRKAVCFLHEDQFRTCTLVLAYEHIVYRLELMTGDLDGEVPDEVLNEILNIAALHVDEQAVQYETSLP